MAGDVILKNVAFVLLFMILAAVLFSVPGMTEYDEDIDDAYNTMTPIMSLKSPIKASISQSPMAMEMVRMTKEDIEKKQKG